jgi:histidinol-phosphate phosphatase family protein
MSLKQAIILAGGQGTRLRERLGDLPKPMIGVAGVPLLERQILLLKRYGYKRIAILVNYQAEKIQAFCDANANWGLDIVCLDDGNPKGTAGAVLNIFDQLEDEFLVVYGDTMLEVDLSRFEAAHAAHGDSTGTLFLHPNDHPQDSDLVDIDENGRIRNFHPYPHPAGRYLPNLVNAALYILKREALRPWLGKVRDGIFDFGKNLFPQLLAAGGKLYGYNSPEYIKDCGTPARLDKITQHLLSGKIERSSLQHKQPTVFIDRDGTLNKEIDHLKSADQLELYAGVEDALRKLNHSDYRACVVTNQPVVARGECSAEELRNIHNKLETLLGQRGAFLDRIYACPHHPDKGFAGEVAALKMNCRCRKPGIGMLERAQHELNTDFSQSWMIGDTTTDIETAHRAGVKSILVETGYAGLDHKYPRTADFTLPDFPKAVEFIVDTFPKAMEQAKTWLQKVQAGQVLLLGGQARSGKSSTASVLKFALQARGLRAHVFSTDQWLRSEPERQVGVWGRHDVQALQRQFEELAQVRQKTVRISVPIYLKKTRSQLPSAIEIEIHPDDVIIFEGVIALSLVQHAQVTTHQYAVSIDEKQRKARFLDEYQRRMLTKETSEALYQARIADEYEFVRKLMEGVQHLPLQSSDVVS